MAGSEFAPRSVSLGHLPVFALSIRQPYAEAIVTGIKDIENRTWPVRFRGRIFVHAAKAPSWDAFEYYPELEAVFPASYEYPLGAIVGEVDITDCVELSSSRWFAGPFGFVLRNAVRYDEPVAVSGKLGLWRVPDNVRCELADQRR